LFFGVIITVAAFFAVTWLRTLYTGEVWHVASALDSVSMAKSLYYILPTAMVQELMFRGYLFTKTISRFGVVWANIVFAILFMLVHVLDRQVLQNPGQLIMLAVCIPIGHLWFATALLRSKTILFPIGLHCGNNWAVTHLFGSTDNRQSIFYLTHQKVFTAWPQFVMVLLIFNGFFLLVVWATWKGRLPFAAKPVA
jgi:membrane protease YdiL (CAAX protease family)